MHFNRTRFVEKTGIRLFFLIILILVILLTSCSDRDIDEALLDLESSNWTILPITIPARKVPAFSIDSIGYDSISTYKISTSIYFDSTIVFTGHGFHYWADRNEPYTISEIVGDTLDFSLQNAFVHKVRIRTMKPNSEYQVQAIASYLVGRDTMMIAALPATFKTL